MPPTLPQPHPLPTVAAIIRQHGLSANKNLGQHFLLNPSLLEKIVAVAGIPPQAQVVEIGPGPGGLTQALLKLLPNPVLAIERDQRLLPVLQQLQAAYPARFSFRLTDAMTLDLGELADKKPLWIVGNLPYNVGTAMLARWLTPPLLLAGAVVMLQKEVAERMGATPGDAGYGRLSVLTQAVVGVEKLMDLSPQAFTPPPKVHSRLIRLIPHASPPSPDMFACLARLTAMAFQQRRKKLKTTLASYLPAMETLGINPDRRPEELSLAEFLALAQKISQE
ncbi:MAG: ribosomal RNA small subunit methyltransferase A [Rhodospirillaceae bacterium]|jgi:16S rRNA (adenine1518-N6/adenine1519-N6)-dimethyltransferase|nr:ribosomal RNA small subunit methyltransferase A [Rhodospirillaceae bacterium]